MPANVECNQGAGRAGQGLQTIPAADQAAGYTTARLAQEKLEDIIGPMLEEALVGANMGRAAGATRRPRKALETALETGNCEGHESQEK